MIKSAITVCLVPEAAQGPFVFHGSLDEGCAKAAGIGFDAVEIFPRSSEELNAKAVRESLDRHNLKLAAMGTGAGWLVQQLSLTSPDAKTRRRACDFVSSIIDLASGFGAPAIIGSMQGRSGGGVSRDQAMEWLGEALEQLGPRANAAGQPLLMEPLNRYETDLLNRVEDSVAFFKSLRTQNIKMLCDLFHMNIEESSIADALRHSPGHVGHVHFADSNRHAVGFGHTDMAPVAEALKETGYEGYVSAEVFPRPDPDTSARQTHASFVKLFS